MNLHATQIQTTKSLITNKQLRYVFFIQWRPGREWPNQAD